MNMRFFKISLLVLSFILPRAVYGFDRCNDIFRAFETHQDLLEEKVVSYRQFDFSQEKIRSTDVFGETDDLLLGINKQGHVFLVHNKTRLDGDMVGRRSRVNQNTNLLDAGIIFRVKSSGIDSKKLLSYNGKLGISCAKTACGAMAYAGGIYIGQRLQLFRSDRLIHSILSEGFRDADGTPIPFEVYHIGVGSLIGTYNHIKSSSSDYAFSYGVGVPAVVIGGATLTSLSLFNLLKYF